jgi:hypothetical protein
VGAEHQNSGVKDPLGFVRQNALVHEVDGKLFVTGKGEQFLQELQASLDFEGALQ